MGDDYSLIDKFIPDREALCHYVTEQLDPNEVYIFECSRRPKYGAPKNDCVFRTKSMGSPKDVVRELSVAIQGAQARFFGIEEELDPTTCAIFYTPNARNVKRAAHRLQRSLNDITYNAAQRDGQLSSNHRNFLNELDKHWLSMLRQHPQTKKIADTDLDNLSYTHWYLDLLDEFEVPVRTVLRTASGYHIMFSQNAFTHTRRKENLGDKKAKTFGEVLFRNTLPLPSDEKYNSQGKVVQVNPLDVHTDPYVPLPGTRQSSVVVQKISVEQCRNEVEQKGYIRGDPHCQLVSKRISDQSQCVGSHK